MIPIEKEMAVREMLDNGLTCYRISKTLGLPVASAVAISRAKDLVASTPQTVCDDIYTLLTIGLSCKAIAAKMNVSVEVVVAVRRMRRCTIRHSQTPQKCMTCGGVILPRRGKAYKPAQAPESIGRAYAAELFRIADDIVGLSVENVVPNLMFYNIAQRCKSVIHAITGERNGTEKTAV